MEAYENPEMWKRTNDCNLDERSFHSWCNGAQYSILLIMRILHLENDEKAYNLGKNLWRDGKSEEYIKDQLTKYADSK